MGGRDCVLVEVYVSEWVGGWVVWVGGLGYLVFARVRECASE